MNISSAEGSAGTYDVALTSSAAKELKKLPGQLIARIVARLESLASNPRPAGCKKLQGGNRECRIRVGDYRVVYEVYAVTRIVEIQRVRHRRDVYRQ